MPSPSDIDAKQHADQHDRRNDAVEGKKGCVHMSASENGGVENPGRHNGPSAGGKRNEPCPTGGVARTAALLGGFALVSRVLGLVRDMCMQWAVTGADRAAAATAVESCALALREVLEALDGARRGKASGSLEQQGER